MKTVSQVKVKAKKAPASWRKKVFSCSLRDLRRKHGLTLRDVADETGLSLSTVHTVELGCSPQLLAAMAIAKFFETTVERMFVPLKGGGK